MNMTAKGILSILRRKRVAKATAEDYEATFGTPSGERVLEDLIETFNVGRPSFTFDKVGKVDLEATARRDAAKMVVAFIVDKARFKGATAEKQTHAEAPASSLGKLPTAGNQL